MLRSLLRAVRNRVRQGALTIDLVGPEPTTDIRNETGSGSDASDPTVMSIVTSPALLAPADGYTGGAFDVVITLSEKPAAFAMRLMSTVDNGTSGAACLFRW